MKIYIRDKSTGLGYEIKDQKYGMITKNKKWIRMNKVL